MAKKFALFFGWFLVVLGVLGFFSNPIVGNAPGAIFVTDKAHNIVHLLSGLVFLWAAYKAVEKSAPILKAFGVIYLVIAILGFLSSGSILGLIQTNSADNWLHVIFGILFLWGGMSKGGMVTQPIQGQQM